MSTAATSPHNDEKEPSAPLGFDGSKFFDGKKL